MSDPAKTRELFSGIDRQKVRSAVRTGIYTSVLAGAHGLRRATPAIGRLHPGLADRMERSSFLQQPTHGKWWQERFYRSMEDPYGFARSGYETRKYAHTLRAITTTHPATVNRALEIGAAEGVFTQSLARIATEVVGVELSETAVARANRRLGSLPGAKVEVSRLPAEIPAGTFDVIVASDVLYYFPSDVLRGLLTRLEDALNPGGILTIVNYMGNFGARKGGPLVHRLADEILTIPKVLNERTEGIGPDGISGYQVAVYRRP